MIIAPCRHGHTGWTWSLSGLSQTSKEPGWRDKRAGLGMDCETSDKAGLGWNDLSVGESEVPIASVHIE